MSVVYTAISFKVVVSWGFWM